MTGRRGQGECRGAGRRWGSRGAGRGVPHLAASWARSLPSPPRAAPPLRRRNKGHGRAGGGQRSPAHRSSSRPRRSPEREPRPTSSGLPGQRRRGAVRAWRGHGALAVADRGAAGAAAARAAEPRRQVLRQDHPVLRSLRRGLHDGLGRLPAAPPRPDSGEHEARDLGSAGSARPGWSAGGRGRAPAGGQRRGGAERWPPPASAFLTFCSRVPPSCPVRGSRGSGSSRAARAGPLESASQCLRARRPRPGRRHRGISKGLGVQRLRVLPPRQGPAGLAGRSGRRVAERPWARKGAGPAGRGAVLLHPRGKSRSDGGACPRRGLCWSTAPAWTGRCRAQGVPVFSAPPPSYLPLDECTCEWPWGLTPSPSLSLLLRR